MRAMGNVFKYTLLITLILWAVPYTVLTRIIPKKTNDDKHPIILIPGDGGSRAYVRPVREPGIEPQLLWLNLKDFFQSDIVTKLFSLQYEDGIWQPHSNMEYEITFPGWGDTETVETLDSNEKIFGRYFDVMVDDLKQDPFFVSNKSIRGAPYDFRLAPVENEQFFVQLKELVEETYALNGNRRVILVGHSMGCLYSVTFLERQTTDWKKQYIQAFVSLAGPYGGAVKVLKVAASGENFGAFFRSPLVFRDLERSFSSLTFMVPDERLWSEDEPIIITHNTTYTSHDYERLFREMNYSLGYRLMQKTRAGYDYFKGPTGVDEVYCLYGSQIGTPKRLIYSAPNFMRKAFPDQVPTVITEDGDGSVNLRSLQVCKSWSNVHSIEMPHSDHLYIMRDPRVLQLIRRLSGFKKPQTESNESQN